MRRGQRLFWGSWAVLIAIGAVVITASIFSVVARIVDRPVVVESKAPRPLAVREVPEQFELHDGRSIAQTFTSTRDVHVSHVDIGFMDYREADDGVVHVELQESEGGVLSTAQRSMQDIYTDDLSTFPISAHLLAGQTYRLVVTTERIPFEERITPYYGIPGTGVTVGELSVMHAEGSVDSLEGQLGFQVRRSPSWETVTNMPEVQAILLLFGGYIITLIILASIAPARRWITQELEKSLPGISFSSLPSWIELIGIGVAALLLAFFVTAPLYTSLDQYDDMGDVQRALITRGLGADAYTQEGAVAQWNPYLCGGVPLIGNIESPHMSPTIIFSVLFGENLGMRIEITAMLAFGFLGAYLVARHISRASPALSFLAAGIFVFSGFQMLSFSTGVFVWLSINWIPWVFLFYLKSLEKTEYMAVAGFALGLLLLSSGPHMPAFGILLIGLASLVVAITYQQLRPLIIATVIVSIGVLCSAAKIIPAIEFNSILTDFHRPPVFAAPISWAPKMLIDRNQFETSSWVFEQTGERNHWHEFGTYVGVVPVILFLLGIPVYVKNRLHFSFLIVALLLFSMTFGLFPWSVLSHTPVADEVFRTPGRMRSMFLLVFGMLVAISGGYWSSRIRHNALRKSITATIALVVVLDLAYIHAPLFPSLFNIEYSASEPKGSFVRIDESYTNGDNIYHASYINYLANQGTRDLCLPNVGHTRQIPVYATDEEGYIGEAYLPEQGMSLPVTHVGPVYSEVVIDTEITDPQLAVLNQTFFPGWYTDPKREVTSWRGLVAARLEPGDTTIRFIYRPLSFRIGSVVSVVSFVLLGLLGLQRWWQSRD